MKLLTKMAYAFIEKMNAIGDYYVEKTEAQKEYMKGVIQEFGELYDRGCKGEIQLPDKTLVKFAKTKNIKQVEKLNRQIREMNGL